MDVATKSSLYEKVELHKVYLGSSVRLFDIEIATHDDYRTFRLLPATLGDGWLGILMAFPFLFSKEEARNMHENSMMYIRETKNLGFLSGLGGLFPYLRYAVEQNDLDPKPISNYLRTLRLDKRLKESVNHGDIWSSLDFFDGLCGFLFSAALYASDDVFSEIWRSGQFVLDLFETLFSRYEEFEMKGDAFSGFAHGNLGFAHGLLAVYARTENKRALRLSDDMRRMELERYYDGSFRDKRYASKEFSPVNRMFCNGHIGLAIHEAFRGKILGTIDAVEMCCSTKLLWDITYCHGVPSTLDCITNGSLKCDDKQTVEDLYSYVSKQRGMLVSGQKSLIGNLSLNYGGMSIFDCSDGFVGGGLLTRLLTGEDSLCPSSLAYTNKL